MPKGYQTSDWWSGFRQAEQGRHKRIQRVLRKGLLSRVESTASGNKKKAEDCLKIAFLVSTHQLKKVFGIESVKGIISSCSRLRRQWLQSTALWESQVFSLQFPFWQSATLFKYQFAGTFLFNDKFYIISPNHDPSGKGFRWQMNEDKER